MAHIGFKKLSGILANKGVRNPNAVAASIGAKKYGRKSLEKHAHEAKSMEHTKPKKHYG